MSDEYRLPEPVEMTADEMISLVRSTYGADIEFNNLYHEADYTAILEDVEGHLYVIFKDGKKVSRLEV